MTPFEWLAVAYFAALAAAGSRAPRRARGWIYAAGAILLVIVARFTLSWEARAWMPHAYLLLGYWIPAVFARGPDDRFERWLARADERLMRPVGGVSSGNVSSGTRYGAELAYLLCYPMVPAAFTLVYTWGNRADVIRFWMAVLIAGYACYGTLPWTAARPPRLASPSPPPGAGLAARLNRYITGRLSHQLNTFPSGHVAISMAAALVVFGAAPRAGVAVAAVAAAVAAGAVAGRYHYLVDVLFGVAAGVLAWLVAR